MQCAVNTDHCPERIRAFPSVTVATAEETCARSFLSPRRGVPPDPFQGPSALLQCESMPVSIQGVQLVRSPPCSLTTAAFASHGAAGSTTSTTTR